MGSYTCSQTGDNLHCRRNKDRCLMKELQLTYTAIGELRPCIGMAALKKHGKHELMRSLFQLLQSYTSLTSRQARPFRFAINNFIEMEAARHCSIHLSDRELSAIWPPEVEWSSFIKL